MSDQASEQACARVQERLHDLLDEELPPEEAVSLRQHLEGCPDCRQAEEDLMTVRSAVQAMTRLQPGPELRQRLLDSIRSEIQVQRVEVVIRESGGKRIVRQWGPLEGPTPSEAPATGPTLNPPSSPPPCHHIFVWTEDMHTYLRWTY